MATSLSMALEALGIEPADEDTVNRVMGAAPLQGAAWENALAAANHFGCVSTLRVPSTVRQLKAWTDAAIPVMIAWNPEGREWSHASLVYDVTEGLPAERDPSGVYEDGPPGLYVWVADPNIPHPERTFRVVHEDTFYSKWYEKWERYLVRRPACAIQREITPEGRQVLASRGAPPRALRWWRIAMTDWCDQLMHGLAPATGITPTTLPETAERYAHALGTRALPLPEWLRALGGFENIPVQAAYQRGSKHVPVEIMASRVASRYLAACGENCECGGACGGPGCQNNPVELGQPDEGGTPYDP